MSEDHDPVKINFEQVRQQLRFWPYTLHQIDDTLDVSLIEGRGKQLLFRAVHSKNLTAFAGSGLSMSYGRLSWREWIHEQQRLVKKTSERFLDTTKLALEWNKILQILIQPDDQTDGSKLIAPVLEFRRAYLLDPLTGSPKIIQKDRHNAWQWLKTQHRAIESARNQILQLYRTFNLTQNDDGHFPGGEELPVRFEIAQQLQNQLQRHASLFLRPNRLHRDRENDCSRVWPSARMSEETAAPLGALEVLQAAYEEHFGRPEHFIGPEQIDDVRAAFERSFEAMHAIFSRPEAQKNFEALAKSLLVDECPHALILLRQGLLKGRDIDDDEVEAPRWAEQRESMQKLEDSLHIFSDDNQRRDIEGLRKNSDRYRVLTPFQFENFNKLRSEVGASRNGALWKNFWAFVDAKLRNYEEKIERAGDKRQYLTPSSRFLLAVCLSQFDDPFDAIKLPPGLQKFDDLRQFFRSPAKNAFTSRRSIVANRLDPLSKTDRQLGIKRYITTNYDFEIERFFQDHGFVNHRYSAHQNAADEPLADDSFRRDNLGRVLFDQSFSSQKGAALTAFSMSDGDFDAGVFHLHGRATKDDPLVVTERDYMKLYLTQDEHRATVDEAINVAFSGAPLLFLGLGMEETDLLRPLRQFISNRDRTIGYTSIALLPADKSLEARAKFAASLYLRYGVHTIFYGSGYVERDGKQLGIDWLYRINLLIGALQDEVDRWTKETLPTSRRTGPADETKGEYDLLSKGRIDPLRARSEIGQALYDALKTVGHYFADGRDVPASTPAMTLMLDPLLGVTAQTFGQRLFDAHSAELFDTSGFLVNCRFSPAKPVRTKGPHRSESDVFVEGSDFVGFYTGLLDQIMQAVAALPETMTTCASENSKDREALSLTVRQDIAAPFRIALNGLRGAFVTAALNAALELISKEKDAWWINWKMSPPHRLATAQRRSLNKEIAPKSPEAITEGTYFIRHQLHNSISLTKPEAKEQTEFVIDGTLLEVGESGEKRVASAYRTRIRTFDTFVAAIGSLDAGSVCYVNDGHKKRRLITVAARRGMGKGTFFGAFSSTQGQAIYKAASWPDPNVEFAGSIFINLGMSPEIASTYDMIIDSVIRSTAFIRHRRLDPEADDTGQIKLQQKIKHKIHVLSRLAGLRKCLEEFRDEALRDGHGKTNYRLLLNFNSIDLLFDQMRRPKNGEIDRIFQLMFGPDLKDVPIDIVFVGDDTCLGEPWSTAQAGTQQYRVRLDRGGLPDQAEELVQRSIGSSRIVFDDKRKTEAIDAQPQTKDVNGQVRVDLGEYHFVHFTRPVNAIWLMIDNFFLLGVGMYLLNPPDGGTTSGDDWSRFGQVMREGRKDSDKEMTELWKRAKLPTIGQLDGARRIVQDRVVTELFDYLKTTADNSPSMAVEWSTENPEDTATKYHDLQLLLRERLKRENNWKDAQEWRDIRRNMGNSRFALTILLAAAEHMIVHSESAEESVSAAQSFIRDTVAEVRGIGQDRRDQMVLTEVLSCYRQYHRIGDPDLDYDLHMLILRHLGVIGTPVPSAVFVRLPDIRRYFERLGIEPPTSRRRFLVRALTTLAYRGLIFRLGPNPSLASLGQVTDGTTHNTSWPEDMEYRYGLHRIVQGYALESLRSGVSDPVRNNSFSPTLYVAMPSTGPSLSHETYAFLRRLIIGLSQYPDVPNLDTSLEPWLFSTRDAGVRAQALRAALTLVRSIYSVSVISRLADYRDDDLSVQKRGYMESYKVRLRWIIRMAWELLDQEKVKPEHIPEGPFDNINALYRDEIVWLYNELGVISFTQGSLSDALGYLRQAAEENERIEGRSKSMPIFNHIDLNHALVQIERANLQSARRRLDRVLDATKSRSWKLNFAARGYLAVLKQIRGERLGVEREFEEVTRFFQESQETRSVAIFMMHNARFVFEDDQLKAARLVSRARDIAETDGHEDVRRQIELAKIRIETDAKQQISGYGNELDVINDVEAFARRMAIWNLQVDALRLRASLLLKQGETFTAGKFLVRAMAIAKRNAMNLRLNSAMTTYAETLLLRGDIEGARLVSSASLTRAKSTGYSLETSRAQKVLRQCG